MKATTRTIIIILAIVATYFGYWATQFIAINPTCFESIFCSIATIASVIAIAEQYRKLKTKKL